MVIKWVTSLRSKKTRKKITQLQLSMIEKIEQIVQLGLKQKRSLNSLFEVKKMLQNQDAYNPNKKTYQTFVLVEQLLKELHYKLERGETNTLHPYTDQSLQMLVALQKDKVDLNKIDVGEALGDSFVVERNIAEASARIERINKAMNAKLNEAKNIAQSDPQYRILSHEYGGQKDKLKLELDQLTRLLSTKKRRESFNMLKQREQNIQVANTLVGVSFEEAQELLNQVQLQEGNFDEVEEHWKTIYQAYHLEEENLYDDILSKDIEKSYLEDVKEENPTLVEQDKKEKLDD